MIIRGWHIDGFGHFADWAGPTLGNGVTVILGANEAGKSTLLAFLRGVLFGFPSVNAKDEPHIPPLKGGAHGGRVFLEDDEGGVWTVERHKGRGKKPLLYAPDGSVKGEAELVALLGHLDAASYRSVFGFDLKDLGRLQALDEASVRDRLLSAWVTGAGDSVTATTRLLDGRIKEPIGSKGELGLLVERFKGAEGELGEALSQAATYGERCARLEELALEIEANGAKLRAARANTQKLRNLIKLKPVSLVMAESAAALAHLVDSPSLPSDAEQRFAALSSDLKAARDELARAEEAVRKTATKLQAVTVDGPLAELNERLTPTLRTLEVQKERLSKLETLSSWLTHARSETDAALAALGRGWTVDRVASFGSSDSKRKVAARFAAELAEARREQSVAEATASKVRARAAAYEVPSPATANTGKAGPPLAALLPGLGATLFFVGAALFEPGPAKWGALAGALAFSALAARGIFYISRPLDNGANHALDLARAQAAADMAEADANFDRWTASLGGVQRAWANEAASWGLDGTPTPEEALEMLDKVAVAVEKQNRFTALSLEVSGIAEKVRNWEGEARLLLESRCPPDCAGHFLVAAVEALASRAKEAAAGKREADQLATLLKGLEAEAKERSKISVDRERELGEYLARLGVSDEFALREAARTARDRAALTERHGNAARQLEAHFGDDISLREELTVGSVALWEEALDLEEKEVERLEEDLAASNRSYGGEVKALEDIRSSSAVQDAETLISSQRAQASEAGARWRKAALARELLKAALSAYATERQPGVLGEASSHFEAITGGRYTRVVQPPGESQEVRVVRADGSLSDPAALSRGTREELYFAIRLGLAKDFSDRGAKLPVLADDVFVNFDPDRASRAYAALAGFRSSSQVIIFTCHPDSAARIVAAVPTANVLTLSSSENSPRLT